MTQTPSNPPILNVITCILLITTLVGCSEPRPVPQPTVAFSAKLNVTSTNTIPNTKIAVRSAYDVLPSIDPSAKPIWSLDAGPGALDTLTPRVEFFRSAPTQTTDSSTITARYEISGQTYTNSLKIKTYPVNAVQPTAGAGFAALNLVPQLTVSASVRLSTDSIISFGTTFDSGGSNFRIELQKYSRQGIRDTTFGGTGLLSVPLLALQYSNSSFEILVSPQGEVMVLTHAPGNSTVRKFDATGKPVSGYGTNGVAVVSNTITDYGSIRINSALEDSGALYLHNTAGFQIRKLKTNGNIDTAFDTTFNTAAATATLKTFSALNFKALAGQVWVLGIRLNKDGTKRDFGLLKFAADGALIANYTAPGLTDATNTVGEVDRQNRWTDMTIAPDGSMLLFGQTGFSITSTTSDEALSVTRLLPNGNLDLSFGDAGSTSINLNGAPISGLASAPQGFLTNGKIRILQRGSGAPTDPTKPMLIVTLNQQGVIEGVARANYDPVKFDLNQPFTPGFLAVDALADGSLFSVGFTCLKVNLNCEQQLALARFSP